MNKIITIYGKQVTSKDGKKFNAYSTQDKNGNVVNVNFIRDGKKAPDLADCPCRIGLTEAWRDKRKFFATLCVKDYDFIENIGRKEDNLDDLF